jgi:thiol-disulfide isomerase/thioredoxin
MKLNQWLISVAAAASLLVGSVSALELGDKAPALQVSEWVKGEPVDLASAKQGDIYIIEFWATWCGPCIKNIPHLTDLQAKFKDKGVVVVGVSSEDSETVSEFVQQQGSKMAYTVAVDDDDMTDEAYLKGLGVTGIPHAVVVNDGKVAWNGHPDSMDHALELIMAGTYDYRAIKLIPKYFAEVSSVGLTASAKEMGDIIYESGKADAITLNALAWDILTSKKIAIENRDLALALTSAKTAVEITDHKDSAILDTYALAAFDNGDKEGAVNIQQQAVDVEDDESMKKILSKTLNKYKNAF